MKRSIRYNLLLVGCLLASFLNLPPAQVQAQPAWTIVVNTATDQHDANLADDVCATATGFCSLRAAIEQVNAGGGFAVINFDPALTSLQLPLGQLTLNADNVTIQGSVSIDGTGSGVGAIWGGLLRIQGSHNVIRSLTFKNSPWDAIQIGDFVGVGSGVAGDNILDLLYLLGNAQAGVYINGGSAGGKNNQVNRSHIGDDGTSSACLDANRNHNGLWINNGASGTQIYANVIGCSTQEGVHIEGAGSDGTYFYQNSIGLRGSQVLPNDGNGVYIQDAANSVLSGNVISGNHKHGVELIFASHSYLDGNKIGLSNSGAAVPNLFDGVYLGNGTASTNIGVSTPNTISGNVGNGIRLYGATGSFIVSNRIGLNADATAAVPNGQNGILVDFGSSSNMIGLGDLSSPQYISGNSSAGIVFYTVAGNWVDKGNYIGVGAGGQPLGNGQEGILILGGSSLIVRPQEIAYNGRAGIGVEQEPCGADCYVMSVNDTLVPVNIHENHGLPIDLGGNGATPNGTRSAPGPNQWLAYPVITGRSGAQLTGSTCAACTVFVYAASGNPAAARGGGQLLGSALAGADGVFSYTLPAGASAASVSLTACQGSCTTSGFFNTSEMSPRPQVYVPLLLR